MSIRIDRRLLEWVKERTATNDEPYQTLDNHILATAMRRAR